CTPATCLGLGKNCGTVSDGCGGSLNCGSCGTGYACTSNVCVQNTPSPSCGDGTCNGTETCSMCSQDCGSCPVSGENDYYVSPSGDDSNPGTLAQPFKTIQKCADIAMPGRTCYLRQGTYRETVTPAHSGNSTAPITFKSYPGERATISGADILAGPWTQHQGSIYKTTMDWDLGRGKNQIFVDNAVMIEARWPNVEEVMEGSTVAHGSFATGSGTDCSYTSTTLSLRDGALNAFPANYWVGGTVHATWDQRYHALSGLITSSTPYESYGTLTATVDSSGAGRGNANEYSIYFISGVYNALDRSKEWYYDSSTSTLYLWTPAGDNPANHTVQARRRQKAFILDGLSYINIEDLDMFAGNITTNQNSTHILINRINAKYLSHYTVIDQGDMGEGQKGTRDTGIILDGSYNELRDSTLYHSAGNGVSLIGNNNTVSGSTITYCNYMDTQAANICMGLQKTVNNIVTGNTLRYAGRDLIEHTQAQNATITYNDLAYNRWTSRLTDLGATYAIATDGAGTTIAYNKMHNLRSIGIYFDNSCSNMNVHHNIVWDVDYQNFTSSDICILANSIATNHKIYNNTCVNSIIKVSGPINLDIKNNIASAVTQISGTQGVASNNFTDSANLNFVNLSGKDFHLQSSSWAVDAGINLGLIQDIEGNPIPQGNAPDIGAYESPYASARTECTLGQTQSCSMGLQGVCNAGTKTCQSYGFWGSCIQNIQSSAEVCNDSLDNDCDGIIDCDDSNCFSDIACNPVGLPADYISYWKFEGNANDETEANSGTLIGSGSFASDSEKGSVLSLPGGNGVSYVNCGHAPSIENTIKSDNSFTVSAWVRFNADGALTGAIWGKAVKNVSGISGSWRSYDNKLSFGSVTSNNALTRGVWYHYVAVRDSGTDYLYVNGIRQSNSNANSYTDSVNQDFYIGRAWATSNTYDFPGRIDDVMLYNRALSEAEIRAIYDFQKPAGLAIINPNNQNQTELSSYASILDAIQEAINRIKSLF
ncbi:MAG: hypothetical protein A2562_00750, partial [Candidatus Nealsonbacteria bacterium RIFOXYD1_FULL_39_11]